MEVSKRQAVGLLSRLASICALILFLGSCQTESENVDSSVIVFPDDEGDDSKPVLTFEAPIYKFGTVVEGKEVRHEFAFTNTGESDLLIAQVTADCGCTHAQDFPKGKIAPGEKGKITVIFDTNNRTGKQNKEVRVIANTFPPANIIQLEGTVVGPE